MSTANFWLVGEEVSGTMEMRGGDIVPIPSKTQCLAAIDESKWDIYNDEEYISLRWNVLAPSEYKNRKIFQKIKVQEADEKKRQKAIKMLAAIDFNAKGGLMSIGKTPTNESMQKALMNKPMVIMLQIWAIEDKETGETKRGNWVSAVSPRNANQPEKVIPVAHEYVSKKPISANISYQVEIDEADLAF